jgi:hypothetical protein
MFKKKIRKTKKSLIIKKYGAKIKQTILNSGSWNIYEATKKQVILTGGKWGDNHFSEDFSTRKLSVDGYPNSYDNNPLMPRI